ncbi:MAG: dephospho-CoA kinase [Thermodesulfobacteriota bacterium]|nr:dephospho-CoA kinase [Thermodesulfobacteriota bacterium]
MKRIAKAIRSKKRALFLGVTGGIATGKTVVADLLQELGAGLIDLDLIARRVVEPGTPGLKEIIDYFGKEVLQQNGTLDRKRLSKIVFQDADKRKRLEEATHPFIFEELLREVNDVTEKDQEAIIQVVVPLLIEKNAQSLFDRVVVVYIPQGLQIERLTKREGISKQEAANMLKAQLPIDDKLEHADFVVNNEGSLEETRRQVEEMWQALRKIQNDRQGSM